MDNFGVSVIVLFVGVIMLCMWQGWRSILDGLYRSHVPSTEALLTKGFRCRRYVFSAGSFYLLNEEGERLPWYVERGIRKDHKLLNKEGMLDSITLYYLGNEEVKVKEEEVLKF